MVGVNFRLRLAFVFLNGRLLLSQRTCSHRMGIETITACLRRLLLPQEVQEAQDSHAVMRPSATSRQELRCWGT